MDRTELEHSRAAWAKACEAFIKARDSDWTPDKAERVAAARKACSDARRVEAAAFCRLHGIKES